MVLDEKRRKMSKSLGNVVDPVKIVHGGNVSNVTLNYQKIPKIPKNFKKFYQYFLIIF